MYCKNCGHIMAEGDKFCSVCGAKAEEAFSLSEEAKLNFDLTNAAAQDATEQPSPFQFSSEETTSADTQPKRPIPPVEDFDWNIHSFPGMTVKKTEDIDFQWSSDALKPQKATAAKSSEPDVRDVESITASLDEALDHVTLGASEDKAAKGKPLTFTSAMNWDLSDAETSDVEAAAQEAEKKVESSLDKILLGDKEPAKKEDTKKESDIIDKFFTFNQKNEEFQRLLDQEYEKIKSGNPIGEELDAATAASEERFAAIEPEDPMEHLFETEGIIKGYQPKEVTTDVLERIDAEDAEKAAREQNLLRMKEEQERALTEKETEGKFPELDIKEVLKDSESFTDAVPEAEPLDITEGIAVALGTEEAEEPEGVAETEVAAEPEAVVPADEIEVPAVTEGMAQNTADLHKTEAAAEEKAEPDVVSEPVAEEPEVPVITLEPEAEQETETSKRAALKAEETAEEDLVQQARAAADAAISAAAERAAKARATAEAEAAAQEVRLAEEEARLAEDAEKERLRAEAEAEAARLAEEERMAAEQSRLAEEARKLKERHTSADHLSEMALAREAFFTEEMPMITPEMEAQHSKTVSTQTEADLKPTIEPIFDAATGTGVPGLGFDEAAKSGDETDFGQTRAFDKAEILAGMAQAGKNTEDVQTGLPQGAEGDTSILSLDHLFDGTAETTEPAAEQEQKGVSPDTLILSDDKLTELLGRSEKEAEPVLKDITAEDFETERLDPAAALPKTEQKAVNAFHTMEQKEALKADDLLTLDSVPDGDEEKTVSWTEQKEIAASAGLDKDSLLDSIKTDGMKAAEVTAFDFDLEVPGEQEKAPSEEQTGETAEAQQHMIGAEAALKETEQKEKPAMGFLMEDIEDDEYEDEDEDGGKGRVVLKVLLVILILLLVMEIAGVAIKMVAPTSGAANFIDTQLNKVIHLFTGEDIEYSVLADTEPIRTEPIEDKTGMIQEQIHKNKDGNIQVVKYNPSLALDAARTYPEGDLELTQNLTEFLWYRDAEKTPFYYDEEIVGSIIAFESQKMNLVNNRDTSVLSLVKENTELYKDMKRIGGQKNSKQTFQTLEIGEIREAGDSFYVWVQETVEGDTAADPNEKVYMMQPEGKTMKIAACYDI